MAPDEVAEIVLKIGVPVFMGLTTTVYLFDYFLRRRRDD